MKYINMHPPFCCIFEWLPFLISLVNGYEIVQKCSIVLWPTFSVVLRFTWYLNRKYLNIINIHYILGVLKDLKIFQYTEEIMDINH